MADVFSNEILSYMAGRVGTTVKAALYNGGTIEPDARFMSTVDGTEVNTTGYAPGFAGSGRKAVTNVVFTRDDTNNGAMVDCDDFTYSSIGTPTGVAFTKVVFYVPGTSDADSRVISQHALAGVLNGGNYGVAIAAGGIGTIGF